MNNLLYTFSSQQVAAQIKTISYEQEHRSRDFETNKQKNQNNLGSFRSKRMKRYDLIIQNFNSGDTSIDYHANVFALPETRSSDYQKLKEISLCSSPFISNTIEDKYKHMAFSRKKTNQTESHQSDQHIEIQSKLNRQNRRLYIPHYPIKANRQQLIQKQTKRSSSHRQEPKVNFPHNDKKLPKVFRCRSISTQDKNMKKLKRIPQLTINQENKLLKLNMKKTIRKVNLQTSTNMEQNTLVLIPKKSSLTMKRLQLQYSCHNQQQKTPFFKNRALNQQ